MRSTTAVFWLPLVLVHCWKLFRASQLEVLFLKMIPTAITTLFCAIILDSFMYGRLEIVPWNFLKINIINDVSSLYGLHPWHWYFSNALPVLLGGVGFLPFLYTCPNRSLESSSVPGLMARVTLWTLALLSSIGHKELRFLLPIVPLSLMFVADFFAQGHHKRIGIQKDWLIVALTLLINVPTLLYLSLIHQSGTTNVIEYLSTQAEDKANILFLMPCHSTPYYSHLHFDVQARFLTCEPNLNHTINIREEQDLFYDDPLAWLNKEVHQRPDYVVTYDNLEPKLLSYFDSLDMSPIQRFFHSAIPDGRIGHEVVVYF